MFGFNIDIHYHNMSLVKTSTLVFMAPFTMNGPHGFDLPSFLCTSNTNKEGQFPKNNLQSTKGKGMQMVHHEAIVTTWITS
jgi:hypothetical protein